MWFYEEIDGEREKRQSRYPRRNIERKDYVEPTVPKDDDYLCEYSDIRPLFWNQDQVSLQKEILLAFSMTHTKYLKVIQYLETTL